MNNEPRLNSVTYSRAIARQLGLQEKDIWKLLVGTKMTGNRFIYDDSPIGNDEQKIIFQNTLNITQDTAYGLKLGKILTPPSHGTMGFLANCSPTLYSALEDFSQYLPTRVSFGRLGLRCDDKTITCLLHTIYKDLTHINHLIVEAFAISLILLIENIIGKNLEDAVVHFTFKKPSYWKEYSNYIHCKVVFSQKQNKIALPIEYKKFPNISSDFSTYQVYKTQCQKQLSEIKTVQHSASDRVRKQLLLAPPGKSLTEEEVSSAMFISKRTLSRRLKKEGTNYREISNDVMNSMAKTYLKDTDIPIENIANLLSYHDSSSFRRAFKKMNTIAPLAYRNQYR